MQIHPHDGQRLGVAAGDLVEVASASGAVQVAAEVSADIRPGVVSLLSPAGLVDAASGNAVLNGIPVRVTRVH